MTINKVYQMEPSPSLEIRKLSPRHVRELVQMLDTHELWKRLMSIIPKKLEKDRYICDITVDNPHKYNTEHFKLIENASDSASGRSRRGCTEILLDEWGTSGKVRPALGHLLYLLTKAMLFRAADYIAIILKQDPPERPSSGPEALITVNMPQPVRQNRNDQEDIERLLDEIDYPSSAMLVIRSNSNELARRISAPAIIPQIIISPDIDEGRYLPPEFTLPLVMQKEKSTIINDNDGLSDMIKFSSDEVPSESQSLNEPDISQLLNNTKSNLPNFDMMNQSVNLSSAESSKENSDSSINSENPAFSQLLSEIGPNIPNLSALINPIQADLPNLSILNVTKQSGIDTECSSNIMPNFDALKDSVNASEHSSPEHISYSGIMPDLSALGSSKITSVNISSHLSPTFNHSQNSSENSTKSRSCTSPLPNLSLNTMLPHFSYCQLEVATNYFNEELYEGAGSGGRFLGSGAFGSVFIAFGLFDKPVAVKKLVLEDVEVVNIDDTVTKQFRNEVEVLSKYKHENLLSLLGYSCDGCTYCLMYEYIAGGALRDSLQATENKLQWKERLSIAMGTAEAVAYLHTAFSTPLIHRDIKSANILLDSKNRPKLCDFGLIKLSPSQNTNKATTIFGTSAYMAPEAFRGDISVKIDTFSYGVVLLELLTSLPPIDETREGTDLVTHVDGTCENKDITPLLDNTIGSWQEGGVNFADKLYKISILCLEEKKNRPNMVEIAKLLQNLIDKLIG